MKRFFIEALLAWGGCCTVIAAAPFDPEAALGRLRESVRDRLNQATDYVCAQTIHRSAAHPTNKGYVRYEERLRLEVGASEGRELYSWPGELKGDSSLDELQKESMLFSTGEYASHARAIFLSQNTELKYAGVVNLDGAAVHRFSYRVPLGGSEYWIETPAGRSRVPYEGEFDLADTQEDLGRLTLVVTQHLPAGLRAVRTEMQYGYVSLGKNRKALLPRTASLIVELDPDGRAANEYAFSDCRAFVADSSLSFGGPPAAVTSGGTAGTGFVKIAGGQSAEVKLQTAIDSEDAFVGDIVEGVLTRRLNSGDMVVPAGARLRGRITRLRWVALPQPHVNLAMRFSEMELRDGPVEITPLVLRDVAAIPNMQPRWTTGVFRGSPPRRRDGRAVYYETRKDPRSEHERNLIVFGDEFLVGAGTGLVLGLVP